MGRNKKGRTSALPIRTLTGCGARVAPQRCPILRASNREFISKGKRTATTATGKSTGSIVDQNAVW
jgi:hypothetical protein